MDREIERARDIYVTVKIVIHTYLSSATAKLNPEMKSHKYMKASGAL